VALAFQACMIQLQTGGNAALEALHYPRLPQHPRWSLSFLRVAAWLLFWFFTTKGTKVHEGTYRESAGAPGPSLRDLVTLSRLPTAEAVG